MSKALGQCCPMGKLLARPRMAQIFLVWSKIWHCVRRLSSLLASEDRGIGGSGAAPGRAGREGPTGEGRHAVNGEGAHQVCMETSNRRGGGCGMQHAIDRRRSRLKYIWPDGRAARRSPSPPGTRPIGRAWESFIVVSSLPYPPARLQYSSMQR
jgi:hypothetical protein